MSELDNVIDQIESHAALYREQRLRAKIERLRAALRACDAFVKRNHNANGGWWNDPAVWKLVTEHIEPALKARREKEESSK